MAAARGASPCDEAAGFKTPQSTANSLGREANFTGKSTEGNGDRAVLSQNCEEVENEKDGRPRLADALGWGYTPFAS